MAKTGSRPQKKEKVFHPDSRKASQLNRMQLRKAKVAEAASKRTKKQSVQGAHPFCTDSGFYDVTDVSQLIYLDFSIMLYPQKARSPSKSCMLLFVMCG